MQKSTIATSLAVLLSSVGLNALDITTEGVVGAQSDLKPSVADQDGKKVGVNINLSSGTEIKFSGNLIFKTPPSLPNYERDPSYISNTGVLIQGSVTTLSSDNSSSRRYIYIPSLALSPISGSNQANLFENKTGHTVILDNVSIVYGDTNKLQNADFGFYIGDTDSALDFGAETRLIAKGNKFYGVYSQNALGIQGKLIVEDSGANEIIGMRIWGLDRSLSQQALELQIDAKDKTVIGIQAGGSINSDIKITKFIANQNSYIFQNNKEVGIATINNSIYVGDTSSIQQNMGGGVCAICSNLNGAKYSFYQSDDYENYKTAMVAQTNSINYFGISTWQSLSLSGNIEVRGNSAKSDKKVKNVAGIYIGKQNDNQSLSLKIEDNTNFVVSGHSGRSFWRRFWSYTWFNC